MKGNSESQVLAASLALLRLAGVYCFRVNNAGVFDPARKRFRTFPGTPGVSDILGVVPRVVGGDALAGDPGTRVGQLLAVECKRPGGKVTPAQAAFLSAVSAAGGLSLVISDVKDLETALRLEGIII